MRRHQMQLAIHAMLTNLGCAEQFASLKTRGKTIAELKAILKPLSEAYKARCASRDAAALAACFARRLRSELTAAQMTKVVNRNRAQPDADWCASHDFCDANMTMLAAFSEALGREPDLEDQRDLDTMNSAWSIARATGYDAPAP
jgi:hypothetical protein